MRKLSEKRMKAGERERNNAWRRKQLKAEAVSSESLEEMKAASMKYQSLMTYLAYG
jgi:hypothetical protein